jgi:HSP20 family protein
MNNTLAKRSHANSHPATFGNVWENLFANSLRRFFDDKFWDADQSFNTGTVPVNIREKEQHYELDFIAPGCRKEDFTIQVDHNVLTVSLQQQEAKQQEAPSAGWERHEYVQRSFSRSFTLDDTVDPEKIDARYEDGILRLTLGKSEKAAQQSRTITVQ